LEEAVGTGRMVILREYGVVSDGDADLLKSMSGLRNVLVHAYAVIDRDRVAEFAERLKADVLRIASIMLRGVGDKPIDPPTEDIVEVVEKT